MTSYRGFETNRDVDYYDATGGDRVHVTTFVFVFDAKNKQLLHIESIGTDAPQGIAVESGWGRVLRSEAKAYILSLFQ